MQADVRLNCWSAEVPAEDGWPLPDALFLMGTAEQLAKTLDRAG
jgi:hypothetical protein